MEIKNGKLLSVTESDLVNGRFINNEIEEIAGGCFFKMPSLKYVECNKVVKIGSDCFSSNESLTSVSLPVLAECGSDCFSWNESLTSVSLPVLAECGSDCFRSNESLTSVSLPVLAECGSYCFRSNESLTSVKINKYKLSVKEADGYCFVIEKEKTSKGIKIYTGYNLLGIDKKGLKKEVCFLSEKDGFKAHGETLKKSIQDLQFKIVSEKLKNEPIHPETQITVQYYRTVTGACEMGCKSWKEQNGIDKDAMLAKDLMPLLEETNPFGYEKFKSLCDWV